MFPASGATQPGFRYIVACFILVRAKGLQHRRSCRSHASRAALEVLFTLLLLLDVLWRLRHHEGVRVFAFMDLLLVGTHVAYAVRPAGVEGRRSYSHSEEGTSRHLGQCVELRR